MLSDGHGNKNDFGQHRKWAECSTSKRRANVAVFDPSPLLRTWLAASSSSFLSSGLFLPEPCEHRPCHSRSTLILCPSSSLGAACLLRRRARGRVRARSSRSCQWRTTRRSGRSARASRHVSSRPGQWSSSGAFCSCGR